jgi:hypothetical protein
LLHRRSEEFLLRRGHRRSSGKLRVPVIDIENAHSLCAFAGVG